MKDALDFVDIKTVGCAEERVTEENTAARYGSGSLHVYSTPAMIALMERAAVAAVDEKVPQGWVTVGTSIAISHVDATPLDIMVSARAELVEIDRRRLVFHVSATDEWGSIGHGTHERFCVNVERFVEKVESKEKDSRDSARI